jgi:hypothetical protein
MGLAHTLHKHLAEGSYDEKKQPPRKCGSWNRVYVGMRAKQQQWLARHRWVGRKLKRIGRLQRRQKWNGRKLEYRGSNEQRRHGECGRRIRLRRCYGKGRIEWLRIGRCWHGRRIGDRR